MIPAVKDDSKEHTDVHLEVNCLNLKKKAMYSSET
jgi:hypothetical protein